MYKTLHVSSCTIMVKVLDMCLNYARGSCRMGVYSIIAIHVHAFCLLQIKGNITLYLSHFNLHLLRAGSSYWSSADVVAGLWS